MVPGRGMRVDRAAGGVDVDDGLGQIRYLMQKFMVG
jgi:hypothetical protein